MSNGQSVQDAGNAALNTVRRTAVCGLWMLTPTLTPRSELVPLLEGASPRGLPTSLSCCWLLLETVGFHRPSCIFQISAASGVREQAWCGFPVCTERVCPLVLTGCGGACCQGDS